MATIGILGGIGPESSAEFYGRLIKRFKERHHPQNNTEFPRIVINSIPAPELTSGDNDQRLAEYVQGVRFLESTSDIIAIACNTAYIYIDAFRSAVKTRIVDLPLAVNAEISKSGIKNLLALASPNTLQSNMFGHSSVNIISPSIEEQELLGELINRYNAGIYRATDAQDLEKIINNHIGQADGILVGCTELSLMLGSWNEKSKIDTMDILVEATLNEYEKILEH